MTATVTATLSTPHVDVDAMRRHLHAVYGSHDWPDDAQLAVSWRYRETLATELVSVFDLDTAARILSKRAASADTWIGVAPRKAGTLKRGGKPDCLPLPALFADVDTSDGQHAATGYPTRHQAAEMVADCPLDASLVVDTGGGLHVWVLLEDELDHTTAEGKDVLDRWKAWWVAKKTAMGVELDAGVLADTARVLRVAGTLNHKDPAGARPVTIQSQTGARYTVQEARALLPAIGPADRPQHTPRVIPAGEDDRPGTALAAGLPVSRLMSEVYGWKHKGGNRWSVPQGNPDYADHAATYDNEDGETLTVFCEVAQRALGLTDSSHRLTSWDALIRVACAGDVRLAARLAAHYATDHEGLIKMLKSHPSDPTALNTALSAAAFTAAMVTQRTGAHDDNVDPFTGEPLETSGAAPAGDATSTPGVVELDDATVAEMESALQPNLERAIADWSGTVIPVTSDLTVTIGGPNHGLWRSYQVEYTDKDDKTKTKTKHERVVPWVAYRYSVESEVLAGGVDDDRDGKTAVRIVTARGRKCVVRGLSAEQGLNPAAIAARSEFGLEMPGSAAAKAHIVNMLSLLGDDERTRVVHHRYLGWRRVGDDGRHVMSMPAGSVCSDGVTLEHTSSLPAGLDKQRDTQTMRRMGFEGTEGVPVGAAAASIKGFMRLAPTRTDLTTSMLGLMWLAPLNASTRGTVGLVGDSDSCKSQLASVFQCFWNAVELVGGKSLPMTFTRTSIAGGVRLAAWLGASVPLLADDYRTTGDAKADAVSTGTLSALTQGAYGEAQEVKASGEGGIRASQTVGCPMIFTAEKAAEGRAIVNRSLVLRVKPGEVGGLWGVPGEDTLDEFREVFAKTGMARATLASYMQWLARQLDSGTGLATPKRAGQSTLDALSEWAAEAGTRTARQLSSAVPMAADAPAAKAAKGGRALEVCGSVLVGWEAAWAWAAEVGVVDLLPTRDEVTTAMIEVLKAARAAEMTADPASILMEAIGEAVLAGAHHLEDHTAGMSPSDPSLMAMSGWSFVDLRMTRSGLKAGYWSEDRKHVLVQVAAAVEIAKRTPALSGYSRTELHRFLELAADPELVTSAGGKCSRKLGITIGTGGSLPRGYPVLASKLGLSLDAGDELPDAPVKAAA